jgi:hypothetical protein
VIFNSSIVRIDVDGVITGTGVDTTGLLSSPSDLLGDESSSSSTSGLASAGSDARAVPQAEQLRKSTHIMTNKNNHQEQIITFD